MPFTIVTLFSDLFFLSQPDPANVSFPILLTLSGISFDTVRMQFMNASSPSEVMSLGSFTQTALPVYLLNMNGLNARYRYLAFAVIAADRLFPVAVSTVSAVVSINSFFSFA